MAGRVGETVWLVIKTGAKAMFKVVSAFEFGADGDIDFVTFTFNKLRLKDPSNPNSDFEVDDQAPGYPAVAPRPADSPRRSVCRLACVR